MSRSYRHMLDACAPYVMAPPSAGRPTSRTLLRRISDAACAFQTGHSVRDLERTYQRRVHRLSQRISAQMNREADRIEPESQLGSDFLRSRAARLHEAAEGYLRCLDRDLEASILGLLEIARVHRARGRWEEASDAESVERFDDGTGACSHTMRILLRKFAAKLHEGLFEDPGFYLGLYEKRIGAWDWSRFFAAGCHAVSLRFKSAVASWCGLTPEPRSHAGRGSDPP